MTKFRFSLKQLLTLVFGLCAILGIARWNLEGALLLTPTLLGPIVAYQIEPSKKSAMLGFFAALFWLVIFVFLLMPVGYVFRSLERDIGVLFLVGAVLAGIVGGYLGARVEQSRIR